MIRESGLVVPDVLGHGTLELFDDRTGRRVHRESFKNFVSTETKAYMKWMARRTFWSGIYGTRELSSNRVAGDPSTALFGSMGGGANFSYAVGNPQTGTEFGGSYRDLGAVFTHSDAEPRYNLTHCAVWTDTTAEDPTNEYRGRGAIVAWSNKQTFSGTDTKRGTVNLAECLTDPTKTKWVFDWPTTAGNGTFQSVGWLALDQRTSLAHQQMNLDVYLQAPFFGQAGTPYLGTGYDSQAYKSDFDAGNNRVLVTAADAGSPNLYRVWPVSLAGVWGPSPLFTITATTTGVGGVVRGGAASSWSYGGIAVAGTSIWLAVADALANPCMRRFDMTGSQLSSTPGSSASILGVNAPIVSIAYDGTNIWAATNNASSTTNNRVFKINPTTGALLQTIDVVAVSGGAIASAWAVTVGSDGDIYVSDGSQIVARFSSAGAFKGTFNGAQWGLNLGNDIFWRNSGGFDRLWVSQWGQAQILYQVNMRALGARTLLGSAVTKANTQTMKVTYEFDYT